MGLGPAAIAAAAAGSISATVRGRTTAATRIVPDRARGQRLRLVEAAVGDGRGRDLQPGVEHGSGIERGTVRPADEIGDEPLAASPCARGAPGARVLRPAHDDHGHRVVRAGVLEGRRQAHARRDAHVEVGTRVRSVPVRDDQPRGPLAQGAQEAAGVALGRSARRPGRGRRTGTRPRRSAGRSASAEPWLRRRHGQDLQVRRHGREARGEGRTAIWAAGGVGVAGSRARRRAAWPRAMPPGAGFRSAGRASPAADDRAQQHRPAATRPATRRARRSGDRGLVGVGSMIIVCPYLRPTPPAGCVESSDVGDPMRSGGPRRQLPERGEDPVDVGLGGQVVHDAGAQVGGTAQGRGREPAVAGLLERRGEAVLVGIERRRVHPAAGHRAAREMAEADDGQLGLGGDRLEVVRLAQRAARYAAMSSFISTSRPRPLVPRCFQLAQSLRARKRRVPSMPSL